MAKFVLLGDIERVTISLYFTALYKLQDLLKIVNKTCRQIAWMYRVGNIV